ncbi:chaplin [Streptomyces albireticuli]|uniref:Chaplin domain-containing protein n=1 Tax=Streptomyces albireticuli TaxID=1940 RepID=A0A2A2DC55_9ACTN|nr:chaplin family protein [Streptomyces albireticuli]MCD9143460.1 DUF320 domain-containing protein [Streptomyces albireticuli]MCD9164819.1 DUF320 domain-containing protein [Streptomyces albireticuli]MCD9191577.1 DUF320 domain-containing protein [Streptomyces albireticuli]PAU50058.1 hypothetical protein CK936_04585 [Streptomyces albireticuli]
MRQVAKKSLITAAAASGVIAMTGAYSYADSGAHGAASHSPGVASGNTVQVPVHIPVNACGNTVNVIGALNPASGNRCANGGGHGKGGHGKGGGNHGSGGAHGAASHSPGVASGNTVQVPVHVPVNACGNSVNVVGIGNSTTGNGCANAGGHVGGHDHQWPGHPGHNNPPHQPPGKPGHPGEHKPPTHHTPGHEQPGHKPPAHPHKPADHKPAEHPTGHKPGGHPTGHKPTGEHPAHITPAAHRTPAEVKDAHRDGGVLAAPAAKAVELAHTGAGQLGMAGAASAGLLLGGAVIYRRARAAQN